jgi:hypothetical protein
MFERLTERDEYGNTDIVGVESADLQLNLEFDEFNKVTNALNRLAAYEDSGLSPEEVQELAQAKADGRMVERGAWINGYCSNCNSPIPTDNKDDYIAKNECRFCYYCGAKMEEAAEKALEVGE